MKCKKKPLDNTASEVFFSFSWTGLNFFIISQTEQEAFAICLEFMFFFGVSPASGGEAT